MPRKAKNTPVFLTKEAIWHLSVSPDGRWIASNDHEQRLSVWEAGSGALAWSKRVGGSGMLFATRSAFSPDSRRIASGSAKLKVFDVATGKPVDGPLGHPKGEILDILWLDQGIVTASGSSLKRGDRSVALWDPDGPLLNQWRLAGVNHAAFAPGAVLVVGSQDTDALCRIDLATGEVVATHPLPGYAWPQLAVTRAHAWVFEEGGVRGYDLRTLEPTSWIALGNDENLATASSDELVTFEGPLVRRRRETGELIAEWPVPEVVDVEPWVEAIRAAHEYTDFKVKHMREVYDVKILPGGRFVVAAGCAIHVVEPDGTPVRVASVP